MPILDKEIIEITRVIEFLMKHEAENQDEINWLTRKLKIAIQQQMDFERREGLG